MDLVIARVQAERLNQDQINDLLNEAEPNDVQFTTLFSLANLLTEGEGHKICARGH